MTKKPWDSLPAAALATGPALQELADEIIAAVGAEVPAYARPFEGAFGEGVRRGVHQALAQFNEMVSEPGTGRSVGRRLYVALGRGEARAGRSLEALLAAYRVGARVAWRRLASAGLEQGLPPETLVLLAESIFAYIDELSAESAEGYADEMAARAGEADRRRGALVEAMLRTPPAPPEAVAVVAEEAQWRLPRELAVVAWPAEAGRRPATRLPLGAIAAPFEGAFCAIVPDPDGPGRRAELERALEGIAAGLGPAVSAEHAARSHGRAIAALRLAEEQGADDLLAADDHRITLLLRADRALVNDIAAERLAPLAGETDRSRERLEETLLAWLRHEGSVPDTARALGVHAQTVRYRLTRLRELLGDALDDPDARFELEAALRAATA